MYHDFWFAKCAVSFVSVWSSLTYLHLQFLAKKLDQRILGLGAEQIVESFER
jgi:hypothetical protein